MNCWKACLHQSDDAWRESWRLLCRALNISKYSFSRRDRKIFVLCPILTPELELICCDYTWELGYSFQICDCSCWTVRLFQRLTAIFSDVILPRTTTLCCATCDVTRNRARLSFFFTVKNFLFSGDAAAVSRPSLSESVESCDSD